jgi:hypothetical protein
MPTSIWSRTRPPGSLPDQKRMPRTRLTRKNTRKSMLESFIVAMVASRERMV